MTTFFLLFFFTSRLITSINTLESRPTMLMYNRRLEGTTC